MLIMTKKGLYCPAGQFYIDPSGAVDHAVITHAHSDHARRGSKNYYCVDSGVSLLKARLGKHIPVTSFEYGKKFKLNGVSISFHPAGHILGSSQVRLDMGDEVWVASGDYKREKDPTCEPFEVVPCDVFVTEATFGTPGFTWNAQADLGQEILNWWNDNASRGYNSVVFAYSLGKTQRILGELFPLTSKPIYCHSAATAINDCYRAHGVPLAPTRCLSKVESDRVLTGELFIVPQSFLKTTEAELLGKNFLTAFASGWMAQRNMSYDHGFLMSDHADWNDLVRTIVETGAKRVFVQHRGHGALVKHLKTLGISAFPDSELFPENPDQLSLF
jgi:putative mRNA 3-end processing factor